MEILNFFGREKMPSILNDPFNKNCITRIYVSFSKSYNNSWSATGTVYFENSQTKGEQNFNDKDFDSVVIKIKEFLKTLDQSK